MASGSRQFTWQWFIKEAIVPLLMTVLLVLITFSIERGITLARAGGKGRINVFVKNLQNYLANDKIEDAIVACDKQKGSLANVMKAGLLRYRALQKDNVLSKDRRFLLFRRSLKKLPHWSCRCSHGISLFFDHCFHFRTYRTYGNCTWYDPCFCCTGPGRRSRCLALATGISEALINTALVSVVRCLLSSCTISIQRRSIAYI